MNYKIGMYVAFLEGNLNGFELLNKGMTLSQKDIQEHIDLMREKIIKLKKEIKNDR